jgi:hypothetical protein
VLDDGRAHGWRVVVAAFVVALLPGQTALVGVEGVERLVPGAEYYLILGQRGLARWEAH